MIGLEAGAVKIYIYREEWHSLFLEEKRRLLAAIGEYVLDIQHVGSTSIPGMPAKPIIDIGVAVKNFERAAVCIEPLEDLGYVYRGENGIPRRHYFSKGDPRTHHLHMNEISSLDWENHILFRDFLIDHPELAGEYARLKMELAGRFPLDREAYLDGKGPFIERVLRLARRS